MAFVFEFLRFKFSVSNAMVCAFDPSLYSALNSRRRWTDVEIIDIEI